MNEYEKVLMDKPSINSPWCVFCGRPATERHHIVFRSQGGSDGPTVSVCGWGNVSGCHALLHAHKLHMRWNDGRWEYLRTMDSVKEQDALGLSGWRPVHVRKEGGAR